MTLLLDILDWIFIFVLGLPVLYLFVFAAASTRARKDTYPPARLQRRFVTLIPAYKSDAVIVHAAQSALQQDYPQELHEVVVIADRLQPATLAELRRMPIRVLEASFENSSKARALNFAVGEIGPDGAEAVAILDADNLAGREFIARMNDALDSGIQAVQAHRTAKNRDTDTAVLDAASEEVNNSIFRRGHVALGFSSALIGSGMAFDYKWFRENIACCTTSGEDKELEALLLRQGIYIDYLDDVRVLDEKVQGEGAYYNQRRRWIAVLRPFIGRKAASGSNPLGEYGLLRQAAAMVPAAAHPAVGAGAPVGRRDDGMRTHGFDKMVGGRPAAAPGHGDGAARRAGRRPAGTRP